MRPCNHEMAALKCSFCPSEELDSAASAFMDLFHGLSDVTFHPRALSLCSPGPCGFPLQVRCLIVKRSKFSPSGCRH